MFSPPLKGRQARKLTFWTRGTAGLRGHKQYGGLAWSVQTVPSSEWGIKKERSESDSLGVLEK